MLTMLQTVDRLGGSLAEGDGRLLWQSTLLVAWCLRRSSPVVPLLAVASGSPPMRSLPDWWWTISRNGCRNSLPIPGGGPNRVQPKNSANGS